MSTRIEKNTRIYMTRGDTPTLNFQAIIDATDTEYTPQSTDTFIFRLKKTAYSETVLIEKNLTNMQLALAVNDTASLDFGNYRYSVELVTQDGYHETFIEPTSAEGVFIIGEELENHGS